MKEAGIPADHEIGLFHEITRFQKAGFTCQVIDSFGSDGLDRFAERVGRTCQNDKTIVGHKLYYLLPITDRPAFHFPVGGRDERDCLWGKCATKSFLILCREIPIAVIGFKIRDAPRG